MDKIIEKNEKNEYIYNIYKKNKINDFYKEQNYMIYEDKKNENEYIYEYINKDKKNEYIYKDEKGNYFTTYNNRNYNNRNSIPKVVKYRLACIYSNGTITYGEYRDETESLKVSVDKLNNKYRYHGMYHWIDVKSD